VLYWQNFEKLQYRFMLRGGSANLIDPWPKIFRGNLGDFLNSARVGKFYAKILCQNSNSEFDSEKYNKSMLRKNITILGWVLIIGGKVI
jgi:hypothetical protein